MVKSSEEYENGCISDCISDALRRSGSWQRDCFYAAPYVLSCLVAATYIPYVKKQPV